MFETWLWTAAFGLLAYFLVVAAFSSMTRSYYNWKIGYFMAICDLRKEMKSKYKETVGKADIRTNGPDNFKPR